MKVVVIADDILRAELMSVSSPAAGVEWQTTIAGLQNADCCIDLLFDNEAERIQQLSAAGVPLVIVNDVSHRTNLPENFARINGWPTLLKGNTAEISGEEQWKEKTGSVLQLFGKAMIWLPAQPGFVTPRVISMIINEAYLALGEQVSTREEIDTAMKLGTNYPYGPFEWAEQIGIARVADLLESLAATDPRYTPAALLLKDAGKQ